MVETKPLLGKDGKAEGEGMLRGSERERANTLGTLC